MISTNGSNLSCVSSISSQTFVSSFLKNLSRIIVLSVLIFLGFLIIKMSSSISVFVHSIFQIHQFVCVLIQHGGRWSITDTACQYLAGASAVRL
jgi:hypothetical protein